MDSIFTFFRQLVLIFHQNLLKSIKIHRNPSKSIENLLLLLLLLLPLLRICSENSSLAGPARRIRPAQPAWPALAAASRQRRGAGVTETPDRPTREPRRQGRKLSPSSANVECFAGFSWIFMDFHGLSWIVTNGNRQP